jgi:hypothetical protein
VPICPYCSHHFNSSINKCPNCFLEFKVNQEQFGRKKKTQSPANEVSSSQGSFSPKRPLGVTIIVGIIFFVTCASIFVFILSPSFFSLFGFVALIIIFLELIIAYGLFELKKWSYLSYLIISFIAVIGIFMILGTIDSFSSQLHLKRSDAELIKIIYIFLLIYELISIFYVFSKKNVFYQ